MTITYGDSHHIGSDLRQSSRATEIDQVDHQPYKVTHTVLEGTEFDELVVGRRPWLHIEQMDAGRWWMNIGGVVVWIGVDRDGTPKAITVLTPGEDEKVPGCRYEVDGRG